MNQEELELLLANLFKRIKTELIKANRNNEIELYLNKIGCLDLIHSEEKYNQNINMSAAKILVFGDSRASVDELRKCAKNLNINPKKIVFKLDYNKNKRFDFANLKYTPEYSDIIFGPNAHKSESMGDYSSAIEMMRNEPENYPKITEAKSSNGELKITKNSFAEALKNTAMYAYLN